MPASVCNQYFAGLGLKSGCFASRALLSRSFKNVMQFQKCKTESQISTWVPANLRTHNGFECGSARMRRERCPWVLWGDIPAQHPKFVETVCAEIGRISAEFSNSPSR